MPPANIAFVREQGVDIAVVCVADRVVESPNERDDVRTAWTLELRRPVALMGAIQHRVYGQKSIVDLVSSIDPSRLQWRTISS